MVYFLAHPQDKAPAHKEGKVIDILSNAGKTLTPKLMVQVEDAFISKFGPYAGWAHNVLFISDLSSSKPYLPEKLRPASGTERGKRRKVQLEEESDADVKGEEDLPKGLLPAPGTEHS